ncbi:MAG: c-type cytochrome [Myxococcota bacterium]
MKNWFRNIAATVVAVGFMLPTTAMAADGKSVFLEQDCNKCHTVSAKGIEYKAGEPDNDGGDLSTTGAEKDKKWFALFLLKKKADDDGEKHPKKFYGSKSELKTVATWLATLE